MPKFHLHIQELAQGEFDKKKINFAFVFQVNCPGCFIYGIPLVNNLYLKYSKNVGFIGISTAFEDFNFNTETNLNKLLQQGKLIGETEKYYVETFGASNYNHPINFPIAFDKMVFPSYFLTESNLNVLGNINEDYKTWPAFEKQNLKNRIVAYYENFPKIAETFTLNQLRGTPTFIIFDNNFSILDESFGYQQQDLMEEKLNLYINN